MSWLSDMVDKLAEQAVSKWQPKYYGGTVLPVPPGYPEYLPKPVLRDGGLYLDPYPVMPDKSVFDIPESDIAWVMVALQPYILQYAEKPYDINWVIDGWGSGKTHVAAALNGRFAGAIKLEEPVKQENFLEPPKEPDGFQRFLIGLNKALPAVMGALFDSVLPGSGLPIRMLVGAQGTEPPVLPVDTSQVDPWAALRNGGSSTTNWWLWAAVAATAAGIWWYYESDA
jgi:hypothetical protein